MALMVSEVFEALRSVGVDEEKSRKAAEALGGQEPRFAGIEAQLKLHTWAFGVLIALNTAILVKSFFP